MNDSVFRYHQHELQAEDVPLQQIARRFGTPCYVYSRARILEAARSYLDGMAGRPGRVFYAVKANGNLAILHLLAREGLGFDVVSIGELKRVMAAGGDPARTVFSGVGKGEAEIVFALDHGIGCFNVESEPELDRINNLAMQMGRRAPIALRVNPDVDAGTHPYISTGLRSNKFGIAHDEALYLYRAARGMAGLHITGIACHIGSQITELAPFADAASRVMALVDQLADSGISLEHVDFGGGLGIRYGDEDPPAVNRYLDALFAAVGQRRLEVHVEPGRSVVGNAGLLLTRVEYVKKTPVNRYLVVDAAMNDLKRPALYDAWHAILPVHLRGAGEQLLSQVVGPVCETGDFLGRDRLLAAEPRDLLAIMSCGAYGMAMSSNYNSRPRAAEVLVDGGDCQLIRRRESHEDLWAGEILPPQ